MVAGVAVAALVVVLLLTPADDGDGDGVASGRSSTTTLAGGVTVPTAGPPGGEAPAFDLENLEEGQPRVTLAEYQGRPVVVNFWASWCGPCERELPAFERVWSDVGDRVAFVGVNTKDNRRLGREQAAGVGLTFPSGFDPDNGTFDAFRLVGMPATIFVAPDGTVAERHNGELSEAELRAAIERLFQVA